MLLSSSFSSSSSSSSFPSASVHALRWWWWFRPKAYFLVPAFFLTLIFIQSIAAFLHYHRVIDIQPAEQPETRIPQQNIEERQIQKGEDTDTDIDRGRETQQKQDYDPQQRVAFAIPVGGHTERSASLDGILTALLSGGALSNHIYVFEDVLSRFNGASQAVARVCSDRGVRVIPSRVDRSRGEDGSNFGIHLARHYHFFLDYLLCDKTDDFVQATADSPYDFAIVIEDDLAISPDLVKWFFSMSKVMRADSSLYCASAHQDNAFLGIHRDDEFDQEIHRQTQLATDGFDFRRGNHFMAPGWMTSRIVYRDIVRPMWLDANGEYSHRDELHLKNGHWDRFFDSMIRDKDCLFPELPRITHQGADGFTVSKRGQMELYSNLRLAQLPTSVNYGDLSRLTKDGYIAETEQFILSAKRLNVLEETRKYRHDKLVFVVNAADDKDEEWNAVITQYFGVIGVGGYGGHVGYVKVRGIFRGAVFIRWNTNLILLVGQYSSYINIVNTLPLLDDGLEINYVGCFKDDWKRDLPHLVSHYTSSTLTPRRCLSSCQLLGFQYAGTQNAFECWCGDSYGKHGNRDDSMCTKECGAVKHSLLSSLLPGKSVSNSAVSQPSLCGSGFQNSVYENIHPETKSSYLSVFQSPAGVSYVAGEAGESCDDICAKRGGEHKRCDERYFPLIHRSCAILQHIFGKDSCDLCQDEEDPERGFATPAFNPMIKKCFYSRARYHRCNWQPPNPLVRACVCVE